MSFLYESAVTALRMDDGYCDRVMLDDGRDVQAKKVITTAGGFEANLDWLAEQLGLARRSAM